jgi:amino-acid N-acetyltransferase
MDRLMQLPDLTFRPARPEDQDAIRALVKSERLNPTDLSWPRFYVATFADHVIGVVQLRLHRDGSRELGSLAVAPGVRGQGIAARLNLDSAVDRLFSAGDPHAC